MKIYSFEVWREGKLVEVVEIEANSIKEAVCGLSDKHKGVFRLRRE